MTTSIPIVANMGVAATIYRNGGTIVAQKAGIGWSIYVPGRLGRASPPGIFDFVKGGVTIADMRVAATIQSNRAILADVSRC
jgi:hypothetical protein